MQRSIDRDYDISYHRRAFQEGLLKLSEHLQGLREVDYMPLDLIGEVELWLRMEKSYLI